MAGNHACSRCGSSLNDSTIDGYCLSCLLRDGLGDSIEVKPAGTGQRFGNYELLEKIGQGGMGVVYRARQINLNRIVAVKLLPFSQFTSEEAVQRFQAEASAAAGLQHPNIIAIHDVGQHEGQHYFSMDYIEGRTLAEVVRGKPMPAKEAAACLKVVAEAVHYAHQHGILHRDLKPSNILIDAAGQPHVADFGLAKRLTGDSDLTLSGQVLGSPNYLAPEQASGKQSALAPPSDVYALGAILYHLLTSRPPFQAESLTTLLKQVLETEPAPPSSLNQSIPCDLETICLKCLEKEMSRRYSTAQALADELGRFMEGKPIQARPVGALGKSWKWCRRQPALAFMGASLALTILVSLSGVLWQSHRARQNIGAQMRTFGGKSDDCFYSNKLFYAVGRNFRVPTRSMSDSFVMGGRSPTWTVPDGKRLEIRAELVSLANTATNAAILSVGTTAGLYALHVATNFAYVLKWSPGNGFSIFSGERIVLRNTNILLVLELARRQTNLIITACVLDKRNPKLVLYQHRVVDTPDADPTLTKAQFQELTGIRLARLSPDAPGQPFTSFWRLCGVFQWTDGKQPVPTAVFRER